MNVRLTLTMVALLSILAVLTGCAGGDVIETGDSFPSVTTTRPTLSTVYQPLTLSLGTAFGETQDVVSLPLTLSAEAYLVNADLVITYDPALLQPELTSEGVLCQPAEWPGQMWSTEVKPGELRLMLAREDIGDADMMTLGVLSFRLLSDQPATLTLAVTTAGVCAPDAAEGDALAAGLVTAVSGSINGTRS